MKKYSGANRELNMINIGLQMASGYEDLLRKEKLEEGMSLDYLRVLLDETTSEMQKKTAWKMAEKLFRG